MAMQPQRQQCARMNGRRLLLLTPGFAADERDHNCIPPLQLLVREFLKKGVDVQIVALEYPFTHKPYFWNGAEVFPCNGQNRRWLKPRTIWRAMNFCHQILDAWEEQSLSANAPSRLGVTITNHQSSINNQQSTIINHPSTIHSFWLGWASGVGERVARRRDIPHFTTLMGQDVLPQNRKHLKSLSPERCERLIALSDFQNDALQTSTSAHDFSRGNGNGNGNGNADGNANTRAYRAAHIIPWGIPESEIPAALPTERPLDVLGAGALIRVKNWEKWLETVAIAAQQMPRLQAELIGEGPELGKLQTLARKLGVEKNVRFAGALPRAEVLARMREAKVLLHTSDFESYGFVLAEAAMSGARIVGTPVGVAPEMGGRCAESEEGLAALLLESLAEPVLRKPFAPYKMSEVAERYLELDP